MRPPGRGGVGEKSGEDGVARRGPRGAWALQVVDSRVESVNIGPVVTPSSLSVSGPNSKFSKFDFTFDSRLKYFIEFSYQAQPLLFRNQSGKRYVRGNAQAGRSSGL